MKRVLIIRLSKTLAFLLESCFISLIVTIKTVQIKQPSELRREVSVTTTRAVGIHPCEACKGGTELRFGVGSCCQH